MVIEVVQSWIIKMAKPAALNHPLKLDLKRFRFLFLCCFFVFQKVLVCVCSYYFCANMTDILKLSLIN